MKELKFKRKVVYRIDYNDWDLFVNEYFDLITIEITGKYKSVRYGYEIVADEELANDSKFEYVPDGKIDEYDMKYNINVILNEKMVPLYSTRNIMDYFVQKGILDKGKIYQIVISW